MLEAAECFLPSLLSLPHLLSYDSSKKYFITSAAPSSQLWLLPFFFPTVPLSVFVFPPTASPDLQGSALALQETCWQRGRSWFLQLQLPNADSPCCQSDTLCLAFPRSWSSTALRLYHGARHTHARTHTHEHAHLIRLRAAFPASVQQNDHMYGHNHEIS